MLYIPAGHLALNWFIVTQDMLEGTTIEVSFFSRRGRSKYGQDTYDMLSQFYVQIETYVPVSWPLIYPIGFFGLKHLLLT
jgi:hypothetical protein